MKLLDYLPDILKEVDAYKVMMESEDFEISELKTSIINCFEQKFIDTATWGLELWERELGLQINPSLTYDERRAIIKSRLRGNGKIDADLIKQVADSWTNGDADISFDGKINIKFNGEYGIPSNMDSVKKAIESIVPAHLTVIYLFTYLFINEVEAMNISEMELITLDKFGGV